MNLLVIFLFLSCYTLTYGQDFSFEELAKLRTLPYPKFETAILDKGYKLSDVENNETCTVFRNGKNVISYCKVLDDGFSYHNHVSIKFETSDKYEYEKIKNRVAATMDYYNTKIYRARKERHLEHIYVSDVLSVHLYNISYRNDDSPYYEIDIYSIYSGY